jgi:hypothetical protein
VLWCTEPGLITKTNIELIDGPESLKPLDNKVSTRRGLMVFLLDI